MVGFLRSPLVSVSSSAVGKFHPSPSPLMIVEPVPSGAKSFPKEEIFGLTSQLRRSAISIPANLAEGCGRFSKNDTAHFF